MSAKDTIRQNKLGIIETLCRSDNHNRILNKARENKLITQRQCANLASTSREDVERQAVDFIDQIIMKGEDECKGFLNLLETDEASKTDVPPPLTFSQREACPPPPPVHSGTDDLYQLNSKPTGLCVIINNGKFMDGSERRGTNKDAESLAEVFNWLGFRVLTCQDQTMDQMERTLKCFVSLSNFDQLQLKLEFKVEEWLDSKFTDLDQYLHHGDAFFCFVLSHGEKGAVCGIDGKPLPIKSITTMFKNTEESALKGKPKVFGIQACQGAKIQQGVVVDEVEADDNDPHSIPELADMLIAVATVEDYKAMRCIEKGSWFIQSLCDELKCGCDRGDDISRILHRVNYDVSRKEAAQQPGAKKQMSEFTSRLTKTLILSPPKK
uniref:Caspase 20, apoptosis-related cysteine peptidase n=1 Tax=Salarias fasciatus TaxID=181472 RepID=A0A672FH91_SALFA